MVAECVPEPQTDIYPVHSDPGVVEDLVTRHVTCHEAHHWPLGNGSCPNYRNKSANSGHRSPVLLELKPKFCMQLVVVLKMIFGCSPLQI